MIRPLERIAGAAEAISTGDIDAQEYVYRQKDQIGRLSASFNRMHRSLVQALRMLGDG